MPNNFISYNRFTTLPANISDFGATVEELKSQQGAPEPDPVLSPMADPGISATRLALAPAGSDRMRLASPVEPEINPYEGPRSTLVQSRNVVKKLDGNVVGELARLVQSGAVADPQTRTLMADSLRRVHGLREFLDHLNGMAEAVMVRSLAASKG